MHLLILISGRARRCSEWYSSSSYPYSFHSNISRSLHHSYWTAVMGNIYFTTILYCLIIRSLSLPIFKKTSNLTKSSLFKISPESLSSSSSLQSDTSQSPNKTKPGYSRKLLPIQITQSTVETTPALQITASAGYAAHFKPS